MREILFRGKRIGDGKWEKGSLMYNGSQIYIAKHTSFTLDELDYVAEEVNPETVGQYTGVKDNKGKMIFEGDIVKVREDYGDELYCIKWDDEQCMFCPLFMEEEPFADEDEGKMIRAYKINILDWTNDMTMFTVDEDTRYKVIGNIYDNPELLRGSDK